MAIVWAWFLYFMLFDWRFAGTPEKLIVGLRLRNAGTDVSGFVKYLLRSLVTIIVPVAIAGRMTAVFTASRVIGVLECLEKLCKSLRPSTVFGRTTSFTRHACLLKRFVSKQDFFKKKLVLPAIPEIVLVK